MDGRIALEEHATTQANNALWDSAGEDDRNGRACATSVAARLLDVDGHLREMDRSGAEFTIPSLTAPGVQSVADPGRAINLARSTNDELAGHVCRHPDRLSAFAAVPMQAAEAAAHELARAVSEHGFKGALINGYSTVVGEEDVRCLGEGANVFWAKAAELDLPVYLHPREPLPSHYFGRNFWLTTSGHFHARQLSSAVEEIGWERVLFSTDYPSRRWLRAPAGSMTWPWIRAKSTRSAAATPWVCSN